MKRGTLLRGLKSLVRLLPIFALLLGACLTDPDARKPGRLTVSGVVYDTTFQRTSALVELLDGRWELVATAMADPSVYPGPTFLLEAELPARTYICSDYRIRATRADSRSLDRNLGLDGPCVVHGGESIHKDVQFGLILRMRVATILVLSATKVSFSSLGETEQLTATVMDQNGVYLSGASVTWDSSASSVASVSSTGLVRSVADGTATITATSGSAADTVLVTVQ